MNLILEIIGLVIILSALLSRAMERSPFSSVILFVGIGLALGQVGVLRMPIASEPIVLIDPVTLTLFTDAIKMQTEQLRQYWPVSFAVSGPEDWARSCWR